MHTVRRAARNVRFIPDWANSDALLRLVIAQRIYRYANYRFDARVPSDLVADLPSLRVLANAQFEKLVARNQTLEEKRHVEAVKHAGGYGALIAAVAYRAFRLCESSVDIARGLAISPVAVRQHIYRLRLAARDLGLEGSPARVVWRTKSEARRADWAAGKYANRKRVQQ